MIDHGMMRDAPMQCAIIPPTATMRNSMRCDFDHLTRTRSNLARCTRLRYDHCMTNQSIKLDPHAIIDLREFPSTISELRDYLHDELMIPFDQLITPDDFIAAINIDLADLIQNAHFDFIIAPDDESRDTLPDAIMNDDTNQYAQFIYDSIADAR